MAMTTLLNTPDPAADAEMVEAIAKELDFPPHDDRATDRWNLYAAARREQSVKRAQKILAHIAKREAAFTSRIAELEAEIRRLRDELANVNKAILAPTLRDDPLSAKALNEWSDNYRRGPLDSKS